MSKKLEALFNAVIVKPIEAEEKSYGNIIVPDIDKQKNETGVVVAVGPGVFSVTGTFIPTVLNEGDVVILPSMTFTAFELNGEKLYVGVENNILGRIVEE